MDAQSAAFRLAGPEDWRSLDELERVPDNAPIRSPEDWAALTSLAVREPKTLMEARTALARRVVDSSAPEDDVTAYDDLIRAQGLELPRTLRPFTVGALFVPWLVDAARWAGLPVVVVPGWERRGHGGMRGVFGVVGHHTATSDTAKGDYPSQNVVTNGRAGLAGPLCNVGLGRSGTVYVVAAGCAYHAGVSAYAGFADLNDEFLGIEAEDNGDGRWTAAMLDAYPRLVAGLLHYAGLGVDRYVSHRGCAVPAGRKPDPTGLTDAWMRTEAQKVLNAGGAPVVTPAPTAPVPKEARTMRYVNLDNPDGTTPTRTALLTLDSLRRSIVLPGTPGDPPPVRAWIQGQAVYPFNMAAVARLDWLVFCRVTEEGGPWARDQRDLPHRWLYSEELPTGCTGVEIRVTNIPKGGAVAFHIDGIGHA